MLTFLPGLLRPSGEGTLCLLPLDGAPGAFVSDASPVSRALLVLCVNQGISASFSLLLSYHRLHTTRFQSIKGLQQRMALSSLNLQSYLWPYMVRQKANLWLGLQLLVQSWHCLMLAEALSSPFATESRGPFPLPLVH